MKIITNPRTGKSLGIITNLKPDFFDHKAE
jgi:hypothetical protein